MNRFLYRKVNIYPLILFRVLFGLVTCISSIRFLLLGWVEEQYLKPVFHFSYWGFSWVHVLPAPGMYLIFIVMILTSLAIMVGLYYRISTVLFFLAFTYVELIDKTYYLNHYYFVSLVAFLMCFLPANRNFSIDVLRNPDILKEDFSAWAINILKFQISCVYFFAGIAKINFSWLVEAMPLKLWLPAQSDFPFIGYIFTKVLVVYVFAWVGMAYDLFIPFLLLYRRTRLPAYIFLLIFHGITGYFFQIGVFPLVMSLCTLIFFSENFHKKVISVFRNSLNLREIKQNPQLTTPNSQLTTELQLTTHNAQLTTILISIYISIQLLLPFRYLLYPGNLLWTENGYRFSWRVMLVEKAGTATFRIKNNLNGSEFDVDNSQYLNQHQEKQMSFQPDMMLQYAHYLGNTFEATGMKDISIYCECYVTMNGKPSQLIIDPETDLLKVKDNLLNSNGILDYKY
ncbi:MAG: HTTM domain-containing protein [Opitutaceae bacterium]|nr:HTTM domain-containing protein [Cytophagales bacterium]